MNYQINFLPEAIDDMKKLDNSIRPQIAKGIRKVSQNPLSIYRGGYGKPLGNKDGTDVSVRADNQVYQEAEKRRTKHNL